MKEVLEYYPNQYNTEERSEIKINRAYMQWKRVIDITLSVIILLSTLPILLLIYIVLKLGSRENAIYKDIRYGQGSKLFNLYKFRTMTTQVDPEIKKFHEEYNKKGYHIKDPKDSRITPLGKILRKTSLDELPNFINVLKGDMSIVGPRPVRRYYLDFTEQYKHLRNSVKPGITGMWQVYNRENGRAIHDMIDYDLDYIENMNFLLDIKLILKTIPLVISTKGAY